MSKVFLSKHAEQRCQQRGIPQGGLDIIVEHGTEMEDGKVTLMNRDADRLVRKKKREIQMIERMRGRTVVLKESCAVTVF